MTNKEFNEMRRKREKELQEDLLRVQCNGEDKVALVNTSCRCEGLNLGSEFGVSEVNPAIVNDYFAYKILGDL